MADNTPAPIELEISAQYQGWPVVVKFAGRLDQLGAVVKRLEAAGLAPASPAAGPRKSRVERVEPFYDGQGTPCCPKHKKPLKQGQYGPYCSAKDETGKNGYCGLRFVV